MRCNTNNGSIENIINHSYNNLYLQPFLTSTTDSKSNKIINKIQYPLDYSFTSTPITQDFAKGIKLLQDKHIIVPVIEQLQTKQIGTATYITGGTLTEYHPDKPLPKTIWVLELENPILDTESNFIKSKIDANNNFVYDANYKPRISFDLYDTKGNLLQQRKTDDQPQSFIWGYNQTLPIAQAMNAEAKEIFHTSFETETFAGIQDNVNQAKTGSKYFEGSYTLTFAPPTTTKQYVVTYFKLVAGVWKYEKQTYTPNTVLSGTIDEIRIYPADALMTTSTYAPLIGKTSETDANGNTNYYVYDSFNRLQFIKDQDGNIVQKFEYKYAE